MTGKLDRVCIDCAVILQEARERSQESASPGYYGSESFVDGTKPYRAELYQPDGKLQSFIATPRDPKQHLIKPLRKPKKTQIDVRPLHDVSMRPPSALPIRIMSNAKVFDSDADSVWVRKTPPAWDPTTGIDYISIPIRRIKDVVRTDQMVEFQLNDGGILRVYYK